MKYALILTGMAFTAAMLNAPAAHAEVPRALSPFVQKTIDRAEEGITKAQQPEILELFLEIAVPEEWLQNLSVVFLSIDTRTGLTRQQRGLDEQTACFRYDEWVLQQETVRVRELLDAATESRNVFTVTRLRDVHEFLIRSEEELRDGGVNPEMHNDRWRIPLITEEAAITVPDPTVNAEPFCYFHTDYLPPVTHVHHGDDGDSIDGYGCDVSVIDTFLDHLPADSALARSTQRERDALELAEQQEERQRRIQAGLQNLTTNLDAVVGGGNFQQADVPARLHVEPQSGCVDTLNEGVLLHNIRGSFSPDIQDVRLLGDFQDLWGAEGDRRPVPQRLLSTPENEAQNNPYEAETNPYTADDLRGFTRAQALAESMTFATSGDPSLLGGNAFAELRTAVAELAVLGSTMENGLRGFVRDFAYFLRRTCVDSPCSKRLDIIEKLVFTDACFPYANGTYKESTCSKPQWKKCVWGALHPNDNIPEESCE